MKTSELKTIIKEESENWTGKDLMDIHRQYALIEKSIAGALRNIEKLDNLIAKHKNKSQGDVLYDIISGIGKKTRLKLGGVVTSNAEVDNVMGNMWSDVWKMLKKE